MENHWTGVDTIHGAHWTLRMLHGHELECWGPTEDRESWVWKVLGYSGKVLGSGNARNMLEARTAAHDFYTERVA